MDVGASPRLARSIVRFGRPRRSPQTVDKARRYCKGRATEAVAPTFLINLISQ
jgi:hypothetical protein